MVSKLITIICIGISIYLFFLMSMIVIPIQMYDYQQTILADLKSKYRISEEVALAVYFAHLRSGYNPIFIAELALSESGFNPKAVSPKGYKSYLQTPKATGDADVDIMYGVKILMEKFALHDGDVLKAVAAYKGGVNKPEAIKQAKAFIASYEKRISN